MLPTLIAHGGPIALWSCVLLRAIDDLQDPKFREEAQDWFHDEESRKETGSFGWVCDQLDVESDAVLMAIERHDAARKKEKPLPRKVAKVRELFVIEDETLFTVSSFPPDDDPDINRVFQRIAELGATNGHVSAGEIRALLLESWEEDDDHFTHIIRGMISDKSIARAA